MTASAILANHLSLAAAAPAHAHFMRAVRDPEQAQRTLLLAHVRRNAATEFGRQHGFARIRSVRDFRERVPLHAYEDYSAAVSRISVGATRVLTTDPVTCLEPSGGSSGLSKHIPYTATLLAEFSAATMPWIFDLMRRRSRLRAGRAYWAVSPPGRHDAHTEAGIPIGLPHDSDYFPPLARVFLDRVLGVPRVVSRAPDVPACRYLTLRALLAMPDLALISVWNPSFLTLLAEVLDESFDVLVQDLERGTISIDLPGPLHTAVARALPARADLARSLRRRFGRRAPHDLGALWPRLDLISCWVDGHAARALDGMRHRFPRVDVQGKGLLATEGVVSVPMHDADAPVCAVASHFLEFLPADESNDGSGRTFLAHELDRGARYEVVLTTGGGLYRYRLRDVVEVRGHLGRTPLLAFVGRADGVSDIAGEKLSPAVVETALGAAIAAERVRTSFAILAPTWGTPPHYRLYVENCNDSAARLADRIELLLTRSHPYALCRALGQLGPVDGVAISHGARRYEEARAARGQRAGTIKPPALERELGWEHVFTTA